uniref:DUF4283 domain-containing protein n=1 Tax=Salix viminalis TaxID=40686 RepID=A0A6N2LX26_SALVM
MTNDVVFIAGASELCPNGGKRPRTNEVGDFGGTASSPPSPSPLSISFKDKFFADFGKAENNMVIGHEDYIIQNGKVSSIQFSDKIKECLPLTFNFLRDRLLRRWQLKRSMTLIDLENNFFIVKFLLEEDMEYVLTGGLWQLDISKPLTPFIEVEGRTYRVVEAAEAESMKDVTGLDKRVVEIEILEATRTEQVLGVAVSVGTNAVEENTPNLHRQWMLLKQKKIKKKSSAEVGNVHVEQNKHLSTRSRFTVLEADGNQGDASKDATNTIQNSLTGVKKATHNSVPKRSFGRGKLPFTDCATSSSRMTYVNLGNKTMPLNCVGVVRLQHDVQGVFSFNVRVPPASLDVLNTVTLTPEHDPLNIDSMDVTNDGNVHNVQVYISAEHSQAWKALARSDSDFSNELSNANDVTAAV